MPDEHKTLEQRVADIEFNLKKLREEATQGKLRKTQISLTGRWFGAAAAFTVAVCAIVVHVIH
jgi:hypothetical protein